MELKFLFNRSLKLYPMGIKHPDYETYIAVYLCSHATNPDDCEIRGKISIICEDSIPLQRFFHRKFHTNEEFGYEDFYWRDRLEEVECKDGRNLIVECEV